MQNLKIRVNSADESKEAQELFFKLGCEWADGVGQSIINPPTPYIYSRDSVLTHYLDFYNSKHGFGFKEITLPELRAMVNPMKEYINKTTGEYRKTSEVVSGEQWVELHKKANMAVSTGRTVHQWASNDFFIKDGKIIDCVAETHGSFSDWDDDSVLWKWQRATQPESLPFVDDEPSLNDQYAEIEQVRQDAKDNVNHPSHYTQGKVECIDALESATIGKSGIEAVCVANIVKYLWRYEEKNGIEDVQKAKFYLNRLLATLENNNG